MRKSLIFVVLCPLLLGVIPVVDGAGVFGPPDPFGIIPSNGHWHLSLSLPPLGLQLSTQVLIENSDAPNGWFNISNRLLVNLP
jgi:hypothetical protein